MDDNGYMVSVTGWEWIVDDLGTELYQEDWGGGWGGCQCYTQGLVVAGRGGVLGFRGLWEPIVWNPVSQRWFILGVLIYRNVLICADTLH